MFIADLHIHSHHSRATSKACTPEGLAQWARRKGIGVLGTGDFTHPAWRAELHEKLAEAGEGLYCLREDAGPEAPRFLVTGEISSIYKRDGRVRKVHNVVLLPGLAAADALAARLSAIGNIHSDGRPILGLDSRDLLDILLTTCPEGMLIPAHIWTPHFSVFGAYSGFDTMEECFGDLTEHIHALETGLSSDPPMNWRLSMLDRFAMISNSDAHSPANLGREANLFETEMSYPAIRRALETPDDPGFAGTLEFFPEEGKYHADGHRACKVCFSPQETLAAGGVCPECGKRITVGVLHRVEALADRPEGFRPEHARRFEQLVPLREVVGASMGVGPASVKVTRAYDRLLEALGPELAILRSVSLSDIEMAGGPVLAEGIRRLREGRVTVRPGYDGEYGVVSLFTPDELSELSGQIRWALGELPKAEKKAAPPEPPAAAMPPAPPGICEANSWVSKGTGAEGPPVAVDGAKNASPKDAVLPNVQDKARNAKESDTMLSESSGICEANSWVSKGTGAEGPPVAEQPRRRLGVAQSDASGSAASRQCHNPGRSPWPPEAVSPEPPEAVPQEPPEAVPQEPPEAVSPSAHDVAAPAVSPQGLNEAQRAAAASTDPVIAVVAGPGTGKTKTLVSRVVWLAEQGAAPEHITAVTFTNKAAGELRARVTEALGAEAAAAMAIGTFHALALRMLPGPVTVVSEADALQIMAEAIEAQDLSLVARDALGALSRQKSGLDVPAESLPGALAAAYAERLAAYGVMDFDDILLHALAVLEGLPPMPPQGHLLVDEFQDINAVQYAMVRAMARQRESLFVIGDPDQAIYGFRGADATCFDRLSVDFPQAGRIALPLQYRSLPPVLDAARAIITQGGLHTRPPLTPVREGGGPVRLITAADARAEAIFVAKEIARQVGGIGMLDATTDTAAHRPFADFAVLYRTNRQAALLEDCLAQEGIPCVVSGRGAFLDDVGVRTAAAFFRLLRNPRDRVSLDACLRGRFASADARAIREAWQESPGDLAALITLLSRHAEAGTLATPSLAAMLEAYAPRLATDPAAALLAEYQTCLGLSGHAAMENLLQMARLYPRMDDLLAALTLGGEGDLRRTGKQYAADAVSLMTLHAAKGLEFPVIFLCGVVDGILPFVGRHGPADADEERRLLYVGITRAQDALCILSPGTASSFLEDLHGDCVRREALRPKRDEGRQMRLF